MPGRRGSRFLLEVLFLAALAVGLTVAEERPLVIAGVMAAGWLLVAVAEWALWRDEPHYASGLPPRWYVPRVNLPPAQPLDPVVSGYPEGRRDEAPTWIASAALRREMLGEWPLAGTVEEPPIVEGVVVESSVVESSVIESSAVETSAAETSVAETSGEAPLPVEPDAWTIVEPPPGPVAAPDPLPAPEPEPLAQPEAEPVAETAPVEAEATPVADAEPAAVVDAQAEPQADVQPDVEPEPAPVRTLEPLDELDAAPEAAPTPAADAEPLAEDDLDVELARSAAVARYSLDPFADSGPRRIFGRRREEPPTISVPARPAEVRVLPGAVDGGEA